MQALLACGVAGLALVAGAVALDGPRLRNTRVITMERAIVTLAVGVALVTPVLVVLAECGVFRPAVIGAVGWIASAALIAAYRRRRTGRMLRPRGADAWLVVAAAAFLVVAVQGRDEPWGQGRDQQVYAEFAVLLADTGRATLSIRASDGADAELLRAVGEDRAVDRYVGMTRRFARDSLEARSYLPLGWPAWLAFAYVIGGTAGLHAANAAVFLLGALLLYPVLRPAVGRALATGAVVALLALPSSLWIAGVALSEPLAMMIWLTTIALFSLRGRRERWIPIAIFAGSMIRLDALLLAPVLIVARIAHASMRADPRHTRESRRFALSTVVALLASIAWCAIFDARYLRDAVDYIVPVALATLVAAGVACGNPPWYARIRGMMTHRAAVIIAGAMVALAVYCLWLRPHVTPFATIHNGTGLDGTRDFREESLRNLAVYVGWPLLLLALAGAAGALVRFARPQASLAQRALVLSGLAYGALYVYAPLVSPDHPWAIRRFVPVVIPAIVAFAAFALRDVTRKRLRAPVATSIAIVAAAASASATAGAPLLTLKENQGAAALVDAIDGRMPEGLVVASLPAANLGSTLASTRHRSVIVVDLDRPLHRTAVARWIGARGAQGKSAWLLVDDEPLPAGARTSIAGRWQYDRQYIARAQRPPLREVRTEKLGASLVRAEGLDSDLVLAGFGGTPTWDIPDAGFQRAETTPFGTLRMTNGSASLDVPSTMLDNATALEFTWFSWAPRGESRNVGVRIDGALAWRARVAPGVSSVTVPLPAPKAATTRIEIDSDAFDPRELDPHDYRDRVGVGVVRIRALRP